MAGLIVKLLFFKFRCCDLWKFTYRATKIAPKDHEVHAQVLRRLIYTNMRTINKFCAFPLRSSYLQILLE